MHKLKNIPHGTVQLLTLESEALKNNQLGDPTTREVPVYLPPNYDASQHYPLIMELAPYTGSGLGRVGWKEFYRKPA